MPKGFEKVNPTSLPHRLIMRVGGVDKSGKTHFGLTAPAPISVINADRGLEGVVEKFAGQKEIYTTPNFRDMPSETEKEQEARWKALYDCYWSALEDKGVRSIIFDTDTEAWEIARLAELGRLEKVPPLKYTQLNRMFREMIDAAFTHDKNLILLCKYKKQYIDKGDDKMGAWNGQYEPAGFNDLPYIVQANLRTRMEIGDDGAQPSVEVVNCRQNMQMNGEVFEGEMASFPFVASMIIEGTTPEDWE
uniref:Putative ATPase domain containing protein n=1 Tax=viral metagenome TaxID=1070528 RepID=A0A6M3L0Q1_9ZZZZ